MSKEATWKVVLGYFLGLILYYLIGCGYYSTVEHWNITDCIYFITVSVSTVGYGQLVPTTDPSRVFTVFYVVSGIVLLFHMSKAMASNSRHLQNHALESILGRGNVKPQTKVAYSLICISVVFFIGLLSFAVLEDWTAAQSFYWTVMTMTTVGYGDLGVQNEATRRFGVFFILLGFCVIATAIDNMQGMIFAERRGGDELELVNRDSMTGTMGTDMIPSAGSALQRESDLVLAHLIMTKKIDKKDIDVAIEFLRASGGKNNNFDIDVTV